MARSGAVQIPGSHRENQWGAAPPCARGARKESKQRPSGMSGGGPLQERDLIVAILAAQAGFVTPSEVLAAAAAGLVDSARDSLLTRLEKSGALDVENRKLLEPL